MYQLMGGRIEAMEFLIRADARYLDIPLKDLAMKPNTLIAAIVRCRIVIIPGGNDCLKPADSVFVVKKNQKIQSIEDILSMALFQRPGAEGKDAGRNEL